MLVKLVTKASFRLGTEGSKDEERIVLDESNVQTEFEKLDAKGHEHSDVLLTQTFAVKTVSVEDPITDILSLIPNDLTEIANIINRGIVLKQQAEMRRLMIKFDGDDAFEPTEGAYSLDECIARPQQRQRTSDEEKIAAILSKRAGENISAAAIEDFIAEWVNKNKGPLNTGA